MGRIDKEGAKRKEGAEARVSERCSNDEVGGGTGEKKHRNRWDYGLRNGLRKRAEPTRGGVGSQAVSDMKRDGPPRRGGRRKRFSYGGVDGTVASGRVTVACGGTGVISREGRRGRDPILEGRLGCGPRRRCGMGMATSRGAKQEARASL